MRTDKITLSALLLCLVLAVLFARQVPATATVSALPCPTVSCAG
ncbi:hypothetical protein [Saccharothrix syringae]|nr:hypothetical protein [Saccharothrix syringae]